jgi:hypothetical protein
MEDKEALQTTTVVSQATNSVQDFVYFLFADSVMTASIYSGAIGTSEESRNGMLTVACGILLSSNQSFWVKKTSVWPSLDLIDDIGFKIDVERAWDMFASRSLGEESAKPLILYIRTLLKTTLGLRKLSNDDKKGCLIISPSAHVPRYRVPLHKEGSARHDTDM